MSGVATIAAIVSGVAAAGSLGYGIYAGQKQSDVQKKELATQQQAQQQAEAESLSQERSNEVSEAQANQKTPDVSQILARAAQMGNQGLSSTMLTGPGGVQSQNLNLGKNTLLGS